MGVTPRTTDDDSLAIHCVFAGATILLLDTSTITDDDKLDATVGAPAFIRIVIRNRFRFAKALRFEPPAFDTFLHEILHH